MQETSKLSAALLVAFAATRAFAAAMPDAPQLTNAIGMKLVRIPAGAYRMGGDGDYDEAPVHEVAITRAFYLGACEVTNAQYEQFDAEHRSQRDARGGSKADDEPVSFVSWEDAQRFCAWLSAKEGLPYRLPTEAEWEYACRAGTTTRFSFGDELPEGIVDRTVPAGATPANAWGLYDMHGNVEEWCNDWYGPYEAQPRTDPVGRADGTFRVTRGGSHSTTAYYLRSANRSGALPEDSSQLIGFRVALGPLPATTPLPAVGLERHQLNVSQTLPAALKPPDPTKPYFRGPLTFVRIPPGANGPLFSRHNHDPAITECANGDLLAIWYTTLTEEGRELAQAASRLRCGADEWEPASPFIDAPDRNDHAPALWFDGKDTIYHFWGMSAAGGFGSLRVCMRTSKDNGVTWTKPRLITPGRSSGQQPAESVFRTQDGRIALACDLNRVGGTTLWMSGDDGQTWSDCAGHAQGIHAAICQLKDGRLYAIGRGGAIEGCAPQSISDDLGKTWTVSKSPFPALGSGRRAVILRLKEGPLFMASLAVTDRMPVEIKYAGGGGRKALGLFCALSYDEGKTWPVVRRIFPCGPGYAYLSVCQGLDGVIHLITSFDHFAFNQKWIETPEDAPPTLPVREKLAVVYEPKALPSAPVWKYDGSGTEGDLASLAEPGVLTIKEPEDQYCRWISRTAEGFGGVDPARGCTAEFAAQVLHTGVSKNFDFELCTGEARYYHINVSDDRITWCDGPQLIVISAPGRDANADRIHVYRLAVRPDGMAHVYRDGQLVDVLPAAAEPAPANGPPPPAGPYLRWGKCIGEKKLLDARVEHVSFDLTGAYRPE